MSKAPRQPNGRFIKGVSSSPATQFKKGQHWRPRKPHWDREWLVREYVDLGRSAGDIAKDVGCTEGNILFWLSKHAIPRRDVSQARALKHWGSVGECNPMFGKRGALNPNWTGGQHERVNPEYTVWRAAVLARDSYRCSLCHTDERLEVHHIVRFNKDKSKRWAISNGVTLCKCCHVQFRGCEEKYEAILSLVATTPKMYLNFPEARRRRPRRAHHGGSSRMISRDLQALIIADYLNNVRTSHIAKMRGVSESEVSHVINSRCRTCVFEVKKNLTSEAETGQKEGTSPYCVENASAEAPASASGIFAL